MSMVWALVSDGAFAAMAGAGFALISNPPRRALLYMALLAAMGHAFRFFLMNYMGVGIATATLLASFGMGCASVLLTKRLHVPAEFFSFPALLPMIPGMYAYKTILALLHFMDVRENAARAQWLLEMCHNGLTTLLVMCALVIGTLLPLYIFHKNSWLMTRLRPKPKPEVKSTKTAV